MRDRLDLSLKLWLSRGKQKDDLLKPGLQLAEGEKLVKEFGPSLSREQIEYIHASIAERKRQKHAQELIRYAVMGAITALAIVAGFQWLEADLAKKNRDEYSKSFESAMALLQQQHAASSGTHPGRLANQRRLDYSRRAAAVLYDLGWRNPHSDLWTAAAQPGWDTEAKSRGRLD